MENDGIRYDDSDRFIYSVVIFYNVIEHVYHFSYYLCTYYSFLYCYDLSKAQRSETSDGIK